MKIVCILVLASGSLFATPVGKAHTRIKTYTHKIQDLDVKGPDNESLYLAHRFTIITGIWLIDRGYVLGIQNDNPSKKKITSLKYAKHYDRTGNAYFPLTDEQITSLQSQKLLPNPLPKYTFSLVEYLLGFGFWIFFAIIAMYYLLVLAIKPFLGRFLRFFSK